jgi:hypothetical protein
MLQAASALHPGDGEDIETTRGATHKCLFRSAALSYESIDDRPTITVISQAGRTEVVFYDQTGKSS